MARQGLGQGCLLSQCVRGKEHLKVAKLGELVYCLLPVCLCKFLRVAEFQKKKDWLSCFIALSSESQSPAVGHIVEEAKSIVFSYLDASANFKKCAKNENFKTHTQTQILTLPRG